MRRETASFIANPDADVYLILYLSENRVGPEDISSRIERQRLRFICAPEPLSIEFTVFHAYASQDVAFSLNTLMFSVKMLLRRARKVASRQNTFGYLRKTFEKLRVDHLIVKKLLRFQDDLALARHIDFFWDDHSISFGCN
jgi:hypothetical protein